MISDLLLVLAGGLVGAPTRYAIGVAVKSRVHSVFPYGTLTANALACLLLGFFVEAATGGDLGPGRSCCSPPDSAARCPPGRPSPTKC